MDATMPEKITAHVSAAACIAARCLKATTPATAFAFAAQTLTTLITGAPACPSMGRSND